MPSRDHVWEQRHEQFGHLPGHILRDMAKNPSTEPRFRRAAIEIMLEKGYKEADLPEFAFIKAEILHGKDAKSEVQSIVESALEEPFDSDFVEQTPFKASFTTDSFPKDDVIDNGEPPELYVRASSGTSPERIAELKDEFHRKRAFLAKIVEFVHRSDEATLRDCFPEEALIDDLLFSYYKV